MSALISSVVGNKKASAPKGGPRRRQPPVPPVKAATPVSISSAPTSAAPSSPPPTQTQTVDTPTPAEASGPRAPSQSAEPVAQQPTTPVLTSTQPAAVQHSQPTDQRPDEDTTSPEVTVEQLNAEDEEPSSQAAASKKRKRDTAPVAVPAEPSKRAKRSSTRSNASVQAAVIEEEPPVSATTTTQPTAPKTRSKAQAEPAEVVPTAQDGPVVQKAQARRKSKRKSTETVEDAVEAQGEQPEPQQTAVKPRRARRKKVQETQEEVADEVDGVNDQAEQDGDGEESDPELHEIDPNTVTMFEIGGDKRHGKTSERERKMAEIDWVEVARKRREAAERSRVSAPAAPATNVIESTEGPTGTADPPPSDQPQAPASGVRYRLVGNDIVTDDATLTIDRQAEAEAEAAQTTEPIQEEDDLTKRINRTTHLTDRKRDPADRVPMWKFKSDPWTEEETDRFYDALKMFGTDFHIISKMFHPKTRRQIKLKFAREERLDLPRMNNALLGLQSTPMDLEHYAREVGRDVSDYQKYSGVEEADAVIKASMAERERDLRKAVEDAEVEERAKVAAEALREEGRKKVGKKGASEGMGRKRKKKGEATMGGGGPVEEGEGQVEVEVEA